MHALSPLSFPVSLRILQPSVTSSSALSFLGAEPLPLSRSTEPCWSQSRAHLSYSRCSMDSVAEQGWLCCRLKWTKHDASSKDLLRQCPRSDSLQDPAPGQRAWQLQGRKGIFNVVFISGLNLFSHIALAHTELGNIKATQIFGCHKDFIKYQSLI